MNEEALKFLRVLGLNIEDKNIETDNVGLKLVDERTVEFSITFTIPEDKELDLEL